MARENHSKWYVTLAVWYDGTALCIPGIIYGYICMVVWYRSGHNVCKGRISCTNIICNDIIYRPLECSRKYKVCGYSDRQTDRQICTYLPKQRLSSAKR